MLIVFQFEKNNPESVEDRHTLDELYIFIEFEMIIILKEFLRRSKLIMKKTVIYLKKIISKIVYSVLN